ncbi:hypothetical protein BC835DRAFT_1417333 [Cytidiella melzeri]|nr:hypothetical protein BC835DRAFT_1417333 [Cytidiella melzeri]
MSRIGVYTASRKNGTEDPTHPDTCVASAGSAMVAFRSSHIREKSERYKEPSSDQLSSPPLAGLLTETFRRQQSSLPLSASSSVTQWLSLLLPASPPLTPAFLPMLTKAALNAATAAGGVTTHLRACSTSSPLLLLLRRTARTGRIQRTPAQSRNKWFVTMMAIAFGDNLPLICWTRQKGHG